MRHAALIVPGFHGSGPKHWQSWLEREVPGARRVRGIDWDAPVLARWAAAVRNEIDNAPSGVWIVAHSFGCLASVVAAADRPTRVAGLLLVAPAEPRRFSLIGLAEAQSLATSLDAVLPGHPLPLTNVVVASRNDPWLAFERAEALAERWGGHLVDAGEAGHINAESGYGPWPAALDLLGAMQAAQQDLPLGSIEAAACLPRRGHMSTLARIRHRTRFNLEFVKGSQA